MSINRIRVRARSGSYDVVCGEGVLDCAPREIARLGRHTGVFLLSSPRVWKHWGKKCKSIFRRAGAKHTILFDDREVAKNLSAVETVCRKLVRAGADRRALIIAIGGGVVGDVAGFVAAAYLRGVSLIHVPTTLVAQVDSAIGGKTGVNLPEGKNLVGAFYPPRLVLSDPRFLSTLPQREFRSGLYEVVKYAVIGDMPLYRFLGKRWEDVLKRRPKAVSWVVARCGRTKAGIVNLDERESGLREVLNLGHTVAHALESLTGYKKYLHGEAVGWGLIIESLLALRARILRLQDASRIMLSVISVGPLPDLPSAPARNLIEAMRADKKTRAGRLRFALPIRLGRVKSGVEIPETLISEAWSQIRRSRIAKLANKWPRNVGFGIGIIGDRGKAMKPGRIVLFT